MKMKFMKVALTAVLAAMVLTGCSKGGSGKDVTVDVQALADELNKEAVTSEELSATADTMIASISNIPADDYAAGARYASGSTASEITVIECKEASQADAVKEILEKHVSSQKDLYASYAPDEVTKLDAAVVKAAGKYVVLAVVDDAKKAESILEEKGF